MRKNINKKIILIIFLILIRFILLYPARIYINTPHDVSHLAYLNKGDIALFQDGIWKDLEILIRGEGTSSNPIIITSVNPQNVVFAGKTSIRIIGQNIIFSDFIFKSLSNKNYNENEALIRVDGNHCRITNVLIDGIKTGYYWIQLKSGKNNRIDHCFFQEKTMKGSVIHVFVQDIPNYHRIDYNYFGYRKPLGENGGDIITIGYSSSMFKKSNTIVENNLFEDCNGEIEIISNKSTGNIYRYNTFRRCKGMLTLRHGNDCFVYNNYFLGEKVKDTWGIRIMGSNHLIYNNHIQDITKTALYIPAGRNYKDGQTQYNLPPQNNVFFSNSIINAYVFMSIGRKNEKMGYTIGPSKTYVFNNIIHSEKNDTCNLYSVIAPSDSLFIQNNYISGEIIMDSLFANNFKTNLTFARNNENILKIEDYINHSETSNVRYNPFLESKLSSFEQWDSLAYSTTTDIDGQKRSLIPGIGADEISSEVASNLPLKIDDVGPKWIKEPQDEIFAFFQSVYPNPFQNSIQIDIKLLKPYRITVEAIDIKGHIIDIILDQELQPDIYSLKWEPDSFNGKYLILLLKNRKQILDKTRLLYIK